MRKPTLRTQLILWLPAALLLAGCVAISPVPESAGGAETPGATAAPAEESTATETPVSSGATSTPEPEVTPSSDITSTGEITGRTDMTEADSAAGAGDFIIGQAIVDSVDLLMMESFPVQVNAQVRGNLPDGCTELMTPVVGVSGNTIQVTLPTQRPVDALCTQALVPYETAIELPVAGLAAGDYTVDVNGVTQSFTLAVDNTADAETLPIPEGITETEGLTGTGEMTGSGGVTS